ncbi:MAG: histidinol-phosphate aminotransferase family protein [Verrucomicrobiota bacterium]
MKTLPSPPTSSPTLFFKDHNTRQASTVSNDRFEIALASAEDREEIYRIRHDVYASELGQHAENPTGKLQDDLDSFNHYLLAKINGKIFGFVSITPPDKNSYSIDKYFERNQLPIEFHPALYEIRLLTVLKSRRNRELPLLLIHAAYRWVEAHGGTHVIAIGRREVIDLYQRFGLQVLDHSVKAGAVNYDLMHASIEQLAQRAQAYSQILSRIKMRTDWSLDFPLVKPAACFHGGAFFSAVGDTFETLEQRKMIINADVLDAWFPPAPRVVQTINDHLPWLLRTSPPTNCEGLIRTIARYRQVDPKNILPGAGSSDLIFRALRHWLDPESRVLILDPTYGEYHHVLENVIGCQVERFQLHWDDQFQVNLKQLESELSANYDLVILVNPNSPTGQHVPREKLEPVLRRIGIHTRIWIDETYVDYAGSDQSLEAFAAQSENVVVCKSMSKVYALSGARVAYLCGGAHQLEDLRAVTPPWVIGLPSQVAAVKALENPDYYAKRYAETHNLRQKLAQSLTALGWNVLPATANFLLCQLPTGHLSSSELVSKCRQQGLFLRDPGSMGNLADGRLIRIAVKDSTTNQKMIKIIKNVIGL